MSEWNEIFIGKRDFKYFEIVDGQEIITFSIKKIDPKKCLHLQTIENRNCTGGGSSCVECGKQIMEMTFTMNRMTSSGMYVT